MSTQLPDLVFIHGMYMNGSSWKAWETRAASRFATHAPSWPHHDGKPIGRRTQIDPALGRLSFGDVVSAMKTFIDGLDELPFIIGHSIGGLVTQKLVNDDYARAAVAISSAPPQGILSLAPEFFRANFPHINPLAGAKPVTMTKKRFHYTFCNVETRAQSDADFDAYVVPESRAVPRSTLTKQAAIDFTKPHVPMLFLAGDSDHLIPESLVVSEAAAYAKADRPVELTIFPGRSHFICNQEGWQEVADTALNWLATHA